MSRAVSAPQQTAYDAETARPAVCVKLKRVDGTLLGFTEHDADLAIDLGDGDGEITYEAATAVDFTRSDAKADLSVDTGEFRGFLDSNKITAVDILAGRYRKAELTIFEVVDFADLSLGFVYRVPSFGWVGEITLAGDDEYRAEVRGLPQAYTANIGYVTSAKCQNRLGDAKCMVPLDPADWQATTAYAAVSAGAAESGDYVSPTTPNGFVYKCTTAGTSGGSEPTWSTTPGGTTNDGTVVWTTVRAFTHAGTVSSVTSQKQFVATGVSVAASFFKDGVLTWLTGANAGLSDSVTIDDGAGDLTLFLKAPFTIQAGDTFSVVRGCNKIFGDADSPSGHCINDFDNAINFNGEPFTPGTAVQYATPDAVSDE